MTGLLVELPERSLLVVNPVLPDSYHRSSQRRLRNDDPRVSRGKMGSSPWLEATLYSSKGLAIDVGVGVRFLPIISPCTIWLDGERTTPLSTYVSRFARASEF
jgi:hypothetical protein